MITGLNHVTFEVRNLEESFHFYTGVLGLRPVLKWNAGAYLVTGDLWIALISEDQMSGNPQPGYSHVAFSVDPSDFEKLCRQITTAGARIWQENQSEGVSLYFLDPDGHKLEIHTTDLKARLQHKRLHATADMCFFTQDETTKPGKETVNQ
jgi:catechol 2,3-dioxygenase-like lactoylglutathione lyase family enzyme